MTARLDLSTLRHLPPTVRRPAYDPNVLRPGIVHLGIGAFHRAHQAAYIDDRLAEEPDWAIIGASLRSAATADALLPQDGLYSLAIASAEGIARRVIGAIRGVLVAAPDSAPVLSALCEPSIRIVTTTVTEKGYCHDPATGDLDENHPDIRADLAEPHRPRSAPGLIIEALARRRAAGVAPFTLAVCDNLPSNGRTVRRILTQLAQLRDADLARFIEGELAAPCSMVDRIVPATTEADRLAACEALGVLDAWPVMTEPFSQWVLEDHFPSGRPDLAAAGVTLVADVAPYERMKLRMLNGSHTTLASLGLLCGHETVAQAIGDAPLRGLIHRLMSKEVMPTLDLPDLPAYRDALLYRFTNPALKHRLAQIATDASQKVPQRLLAPIRDRLAHDLPIECLALSVAGWLRLAAGPDDAGARISLQDPLAPRLAEIARHHAGDPDAYLAACLRLSAVFGEDLPSDPRFLEPVRRHLRALFAKGARHVLRSLDEAARKAVGGGGSSA